MSAWTRSRCAAWPWREETPASASDSEIVEVTRVEAAPCGRGRRRVSGGDVAVTAAVMAVGRRDL